MRLLRKQPEKARSKAYERLDRLPSTEVLNWGDQALSGTWRCLDQYRHHGTPESLQEAREGLEALVAVLDVLENRQ